MLTPPSVGLLLIHFFHMLWPHLFSCLLFHWAVTLLLFSLLWHKQCSLLCVGSYWSIHLFLSRQKQVNFLAMCHLYVNWYHAVLKHNGVCVCACVCVCVYACVCVSVCVCV